MKNSDSEISQELSLAEERLAPNHPSVMKGTMPIPKSPLVTALAETKAAAVGTIFIIGLGVRFRARFVRALRRAMVHPVLEEVLKWLRP